MLPNHRMNKYYTCDPNVIERGTHGCYFCNKSLYTYLRNNEGKYTILSVNPKGTMTHEVKIPSNLCIKVFLENKREYTKDKVTIKKVLGRDFAFDKKNKVFLGYKLYYNEVQKSYIIDDSIVDAIEEYKNILILQNIFGEEYERYILHPRENALMYLITLHDSPQLFETDENRMELTRNCLPILLSKACNNKVKLTDKNVNKYINDIINILKIIHSKGFIHSDMKLINTVKCGTNFKIIDWGSLIHADTHKILETTYIMPFIAVWTLYQFDIIKTVESISSWEQLEKLESLYGDKVINAHFIGHHGWHFALVSYNMFYNYYKNKVVELAYLNKKNDEYGVAYEVYLCLVQYIDKDELYKMLLNIKMIGDHKYKKIIMNLYYLMSPEYLGLEKI